MRSLRHFRASRRSGTCTRRCGRCWNSYRRRFLKRTLGRAGVTVAISPPGRGASCARRGDISSTSSFLRRASYVELLTSAFTPELQGLQHDVQEFAELVRAHGGEAVVTPGAERIRIEVYLDASATVCSRRRRNRQSLRGSLRERRSAVRNVLDHDARTCSLRKGESCSRPSVVVFKRGVRRICRRSTTCGS